MRCEVVTGIIVLSLASPPCAADKAIAEPRAVALAAKDIGEGWTLWQGGGDIERIVGTALHVDAEGTIWVGTSRGRVFSRRGDAWTLELALPDVQVTGIATGAYAWGRERVEGVVWLSTSDGIRRLTPGGNGWHVERYRNYYEGDPAFVSGAYIPGEDGVRLWGYVDDIFIPQRIAAYAPYVVSTEHGLFCWAGYHGVWHHFLPHYWGANSDWLDTRDLLPHRRPTCIVEDADGNLWVGSDGDGLLRMNAHARRFHERSAEDNEKDGREWTRFGSDALACDFDVVTGLSVRTEKGIWATLADRDKRRYIARFDGKRWQTLEMLRVEQQSWRQGKLVGQSWWEAKPVSIAEPLPGTVLVGVWDPYNHTGLYRLDWQQQSFETVEEVEFPVTHLETAPNGTLWALCRWGVYARKFTNGD